MNLLLLVQDEGWLSTALHNAGRSTPVALARSPEDAVDQLLRAPEPFSHVLVEPGVAGGWLPNIAAAVARHAHRTSLVLLGAETALSLETSAIRTPLPADLVRIISTGDDGALALSPADIAAAFDAGQVVCEFQPIVRLTDGVPVGLEALARLQHPLRGRLTPAWFVPQVETSGLSMQLTEAVVRAAMGGIEARFLQRNAMFMTINLPLDVLLQPPALSMLETYRNAAGIAIEHILIELTESRPVFDIPALAEALGRWRQVGYHLAIDDLGPEMVNQSELFDLPFDMVKLDMGIVLRSRENPLAQRYLQRTIASAQARSLAVIAEGIEDAPLWIGMRDLGVDYAQGFLIARSMPASALDGWLLDWDARLRAPAGPV